MRITVVMGFFLPMPPVAGGAVEKSWHSLSRALVKQGHEITVISRTWKDWPECERIDGVNHVRLKGYNHSSRLCINLMLDLLWCLRVHRQLPEADVVVVNAISLACWLGLLKRKAGKVVLMIGRMPKGQFRFYRKLARIYVPSTPVKAAAVREGAKFAQLIRTVGYPINWHAITQGAAHRSDQIITFGFIGRINREKGLDMLIEATQALAKLPLPAWRLIICGPDDISQGGSGRDYLAALRKVAPPQVEFRPAVFDEPALHSLYRQLDVFCYPSLAAQGETFGVAVAEAMAAGAVPIVSNLACFMDFVEDGQSGLVFDPRATNASGILADLLRALILDKNLRARLGTGARSAVERYDTENFTKMIAQDFRQLTAVSDSASSEA